MQVSRSTTKETAKRDGFYTRVSYNSEGLKFELDILSDSLRVRLIGELILPICVLLGRESFEGTKEGRYNIRVLLSVYQYLLAPSLSKNPNDDEFLYTRVSQKCMFFIYSIFIPYLQ